MMVLHFFKANTIVTIDCIFILKNYFFSKKNCVCFVKKGNKFVYIKIKAKAQPPRITTSRREC